MPARVYPMCSCPAHPQHYTPCPILEKDFTEADVTVNKEKLDDLIV